MRRIQKRRQTGIYQTSLSGIEKTGAAKQPYLNNLIIRTLYCFSLAFLVFFMQAGFGIAGAGYLIRYRNVLYYTKVEHEFV
jgi:hypothetical protein